MGSLLEEYMASLRSAEAREGRAWAYVFPAASLAQHLAQTEGPGNAGERVDGIFFPLGLLLPPSHTLCFTSAPFLFLFTQPLSALHLPLLLLVLWPDAQALLTHGLWLPQGRPPAPRGVPSAGLPSAQGQAVRRSSHCAISLQDCPC